MESEDRDSSLWRCLNKSIEEIKIGNQVLPALWKIQEICRLYPEAPPDFEPEQRSASYYRHEVIRRLQRQQLLAILICNDLVRYMKKTQFMAKEHADLNPYCVFPESRFNHVQEVEERLNFIRFILKEGQLWLCAPPSKMTWFCLAENSVYVNDREACFKFFYKVMGEEPDLDPLMIKYFFEEKVLQLDPCLLTEEGFKCFERFFKVVNSEEGKLEEKEKKFLVNDLECLGMDYLWRVVFCADENVANKAIYLMKEIYSNLGPQLLINQMEIHKDFVCSCTDRFREGFEAVIVVEGNKVSLNRARQEITKMGRILNILWLFVGHDDEVISILPNERYFDRFLEPGCSKEGIFEGKEKAFQINGLELLGLDYLWKIVIYANEDGASRAVESLKETYKNPKGRFHIGEKKICVDFEQFWMDHIKPAYDKITISRTDEYSVNRVRQKITRIHRIFQILKDYLGHCDKGHADEMSACE